MAAVTAQPLIHQDRGKLAAFASASAIAEEEAAPVDGAFSIGHQFEPAFRHAIAAGRSDDVASSAWTSVSSWARLSTVADHFGGKLGT
jgi:hypothetical protein